MSQRVTNQTPVTSDTVVKSAAGKVYQIFAANTHATAASAIELNDSTDDSGTDLLAFNVEAIDQSVGPKLLTFDPPVECATGIYIDITGGTANVLVHWT